MHILSDYVDYWTTGLHGVLDYVDYQTMQTRLLAYWTMQTAKLPGLQVCSEFQTTGLCGLWTTRLPGLLGLLAYMPTPEMPTLPYPMGGSRF